MTYIRLCFFVWILFYSAPSWSASSITNISEVDDGEINQIVIHTNGSFKFKTFFLDDPYRLVIDLYGVTIRTDIPRKSKTPMVSTIRFSENPDAIRPNVPIEQGIITIPSVLKLPLAMSAELSFHL